MKFYQEITLISEPDISLGFIWQKLYQQLHIALVENKVEQKHSAIGVGFPRYGSKEFPLGNKLRLFAKNKAELEQLSIENYLSRLTDYLHIKSVQEVPIDAVPVCFVRESVKGEARIEKDMQAKAQLWSEKSGKPLQECLTELEKTKPKSTSDLPFIWLESQETKRRSPDARGRFPLFIRRIELDVTKEAHFNCYGLALSNTDKTELAGTPHF